MVARSGALLRSMSAKRAPVCLAAEGSLSCPGTSLWGQAEQLKPLSARNLMQARPFRAAGSADRLSPARPWMCPCAVQTHPASPTSPSPLCRLTRFALPQRRRQSCPTAQPGSRCLMARGARLWLSPARLSSSPTGCLPRRWVLTYPCCVWSVLAPADMLRRSASPGKAACWLNNRASARGLYICKSAVYINLDCTEHLQACLDLWHGSAYDLRLVAGVRPLGACPLLCCTLLALHGLQSASPQQQGHLYTTVEECRS